MNWRRERYQWRIRGREIPLGGRTLVMGVLDVSGWQPRVGGTKAEGDAWLQRALELQALGADLIDLTAMGEKLAARISAEGVGNLVPVTSCQAAQRSASQATVDRKPSGRSIGSTSTPDWRNTRRSRGVPGGGLSSSPRIVSISRRSVPRAGLLWPSPSRSSTLVRRALGSKSVVSRLARSVTRS